MEDMLAEGGTVVEYHSCDFFPERWFDLVVVLQAETSVLWDRLAEGGRNYSEAKIKENEAKDKAEALLLSGRALWNAGIFLCSAQSLLSALAQHAPDILQAC